MPIKKIIQTFRLHYCSLLLALLLISPVNSKAQISKSQEYLQQLESAKNVDDSIRLYYKASSWSMREGNMEQSGQYARIGLMMCKRTANNEFYANGFYSIANYFMHKGQMDSAKYYAEKTVDVYDKSGKKGIYYSYALNAIAGYYVVNNDAATAIKYAHKQMDAAVEVKDTTSISNAFTMLCIVYDLMKDSEKSIEYAEKALAFNRLNKSGLNLQIVLGNLATLYIDNQKIEKALPLLFESVSIAESDMSVGARERGMAYMLIGNCYAYLNKYDSSIYYLKKAEVDILAVNQPDNKIRLWDLFANAYKEQKKYDEAIVYVDKSLALQAGNTKDKAYSLTLKLKSEILALNGDFAKAYKLHLEHSKISDSNTNITVRNTIAELQEKYESDKKDIEIAQQQQVNGLLRNESLLKDKQLKSELLLKNVLESKNELAQEQILQDSALKASLARENSLKHQQLSQEKELNTSLKAESILREATLNNQRKINAILVGGFAVVLLLTVLILTQYRKQKKANDTIQEQSNKLTLLMKELHHRVKNNLQIISSLLSLQSFKITDNAAAKAVKEGQQRVEAMSLIHQRLYTRDNVTEINIKEFISDLVDSLQSAYGFRPDEISVQLNISDELMNVDQAIPLSLIVNELVTNAFKYAYEDNDTPELRISLNRDKDGINLEVADNGKGVNIDEWKDKEGSFGKDLIATFVKQLNGYLSIAIDNGSQFKLSIPNAA